MNLVVEVDEVRAQQRATVIAAVELRKKGRRWQRRKGVEKRLGFDPAQQDSEGEEEAVAAGRAMRERQRALLIQLPELPERKETTSARPPSRRSSPHPSPAKFRRVRLPSNSEEDLPSELRRHPLIIVSDSEEERPILMSTKRRHILRIDSESETEEPTLAPAKRRYTLRIDSDSETEHRPLATNSVNRAPRPLDRSSTSHSLQPQAAPTAPVWRRRIISDDEDDRIELAPGRQDLIRRVRGGRRLPARRHRRTANAFVEMEADDGKDEEESESENAPSAAPTSTPTSDTNSDSVSDSNSNSNSNSDSDSDSNSDSDADSDSDSD